VKTVGGLVNANGSLGVGNGFAVMKLTTGTYLVRFAVGTWPSFPAVVVTPFGGGTPRTAHVDSLVAPSDGSASVVVVMSAAATGAATDSAFLFTAAAT
jgi:hypothetical protein